MVVIWAVVGTHKRWVHCCTCYDFIHRACGLRAALHCVPLLPSNFILKISEISSKCFIGPRLNVLTHQIPVRQIGLIGNDFLFNCSKFTTSMCKILRNRLALAFYLRKLGSLVPRRRRCHSWRWVTRQDGSPTDSWMNSWCLGTIQSWCSCVRDWGTMESSGILEFLLRKRKHST